jgi:hypothetical protein
MNQEQVLSQLGHLLSSVGPLIVVFGFANEVQVGVLDTAILALAGAGMTIGSFLWSLYKNQHKNIVATAAAIVNVSPVEQAKVGIETPVTPSVK